MFYQTISPCCLSKGMIPIRNSVYSRLLYRPTRFHAPTAAFNNNGGGGGNGSSDVPSSNSTNSFLRHPAIAQREALRQFYLSTCPIEQLEVITISKEYLDPPTSLHMMCHLADLSLKGQLEGDAASQDAILHALFNTLAEHISSLPAQSIGAVLWSMASVQQYQHRDSSTSSTTIRTDSQTHSSSYDRTTWKAEVIEQVALLEGGCGKVSKYNTKELVNILFSIGALQNCAAPSEAVIIYSTELMEQLATRMESTPYVKGSLSPSDFADLVSVCASMFVRNLDFDNGKENINADSLSLPPAALHLMDLVAGEVRRQLANRSSSRAAFLPRELTRFLTNFASLEMKNNSNVDGLFDVISGFVANRIRSKHLNAVTKPDDLASVLAAYAKQQHRSVSVPELLTAVGEQLRINAARMQELQIAKDTAAAEASTSTSSNLNPFNGGPPDFGCSFPTLISILESHRELGFAPDPLTLTALLPGIKRSLVINSSSTTAVTSHNCNSNVVHLLELFLLFEFNPGPGMLELLVAKVEDSSCEENCDEKGKRDAVQAARKLVAALNGLRA